MNNPVRPIACEIIDVKKESQSEWTFKVKSDIKPSHGQFLQLSSLNSGSAYLSICLR